MIIYNTTFMIEQAVKPAFLDWMRNEALSIADNNQLPARAPRLTTVVDVPGDPEFAAQAASFALQFEFLTIDEARKWADIALSELAGKFTSKFGPERGLIFSTILEEIDL